MAYYVVTVEVVVDLNDGTPEVDAETEQIEAIRIVREHLEHGPDEITEVTQALAGRLDQQHNLENEELCCICNEGDHNHLAHPASERKALGLR